MAKKERRKFKGKLSGFKSKEERNFEKKHLKAYLRGWDRFRFGFDKLMQPIYYNVKK